MGVHSPLSISDAIRAIYLNASRKTSSFKNDLAKYSSTIDFILESDDEIPERYSYKFLSNFLVKEISLKKLLSMQMEELER